VSRVPTRDNPDAHLTSKNRFECRSCPYQYVLDKRYYERRTLKRKEVDDILGGASAWENVDKTKGEFRAVLGIVERLEDGEVGPWLIGVNSQLSEGRVRWGRGVLLPAADS
jgi:hypothetical protein